MEDNYLKKQPKTEIISTRVTPEQREIIEEKAYSSYRTPSMYLRDCALGKKIIVVEMTDEPMSLLVANGRYATVKGLQGLTEYNWQTMPKTRTNTEQK